MKERDRDGLRTAAFWREKADEARAAAAAMSARGGKETMERIADLYERMGEHAQKRQAMLDRRNSETSQPPSPKNGLH